MVKRNIVHIEIPSKDTKVSGEFYGKLFGWHIEYDERMDYTMWDPHEGPGGGFFAVERDAQIGEILLHVNSEDIEADLAQAIALGGTLIRTKSEIPGIGWWGVFKDPTGNQIALFTGMNPAV